MESKIRRGISLIMLIITIIVMIILAGAVILAVSESGIFNTTNKATLQTDLKNFQEQLEVYKAGKMINDIEFDESSLFAYNDTLLYNTITEEEKQSGNLYTILPEAQKYGERIYIEAGELVFDAKGREISWCSTVGIKVSGFYIVDGVLKSVLGVENLIDNTGTLTLPSTVKEIEQGAFYSTPTLKHLIIPGTVEKINHGAFSSNEYLETVEIQDGVKKIDNSAFSRCTKLKKVILPNSLVELGQASFRGCTSLESIELSNNIVELPNYVFSDCKALTSITLPEKITKIGEAFSGCSQLVKLNIPKNVTSIAKDAFAECELLELTIDKGNNSYKIENGLLCSKDGKNVIQIFNLSAIKELIIPDGVETISLKKAYNLKKLVIPASVKTIESLYVLPRLSEVEISENNQSYSADNGAIYNKDKTTLICCFCQEERYVVDEGVTKLAQDSFESNVNLKELILPESLETISTLAITNCAKLQKIYIGKSVSQLTGYSLADLPSLTEVTINPDNTNFKVENNMILANKGKTLVKFFGNLESAEIPSTITQIGKAAFYGQRKLKNITFKSGLISLDSEIFPYCTSLTKIELPNTVSEISLTAFNSATVLKEIIINKSKDSIKGAPWGSPFGTKAIIWSD